MDKEQSAVKKFLGELEIEEKNPFQENQEDAFATEIVEGGTEEVIEEKAKEEKPLPFHKDRKVLKFINEEINKRLENFKPQETEREKKQENDEVVDALVAVIGDDTPEKRRAVQALRDRLDEGTRKITDWENKQREAAQADRQAEEELQTAFEGIEENYDVDFSTASGQKVRQEFVAFVEKIAPKDRNGDIVDYPDMASAWETFQEIQKSTATPSRAKDLASRGMRRSAETRVEPQKRITWDTAEEFVESLGKK